MPSLSSCVNRRGLERVFIDYLKFYYYRVYKGCVLVFSFFFKEEKLVNKKLIHFSQLPVSVQTYPSTHSHLHTFIHYFVVK